MQRDIALADVEACRSILRRGSKSFTAAARLLPERVRLPATVLYAFCRIADDAVDDDPSASEATVQALSARLDRAYAGAPDDHPVDRALSVVIARHGVPRALLDALLEGFVWDAQGRRYETLDDVHAYAARVAGAVGAMMTVVMGPRAPEVLARACDLGVAMQLTNIARDVGEDARRGRIYLPLAWLREAGISPEELIARPSPSASLGRIVARLLEEADRLYRRADTGIASLPEDCRTAIFAARLIYSDIGRYIERARYDSITKRAQVPGSRKLWLLFRSFRARWMRAPSQRQAEPPLEPTRFLVRACGEAQ